MQERSQGGQVAVSLTMAAEEPFQAQLRCHTPARSCALILAPDQDATPSQVGQVAQWHLLCLGLNCLPYAQDETMVVLGFRRCVL